MPLPALSVILPGAGSFASVAATIQHLRQQSVAREIELIIMAPDADRWRLPADLDVGFHSVRLIALGRMLPIHRAFAAGVAQASAPVVAFMEDHVFPEPGWAEALLARHRGPWAAVGPVVRNANPETAASWADFILAYGPWCEGTKAGAAAMLPGHNSSYKREVLVRAGRNLDDCLEAESVFHETLRREGAALFLESAAVIRHLNFARLDVLVRVQWQYARQYAGRRSAHWPIWRKLFHFFAAPLIPVIRFARLIRTPVVLPANVSRVGVLAILLINLVEDGFGQALGYLTGSGGSAEYLTGYEYDRTRFS